MLTRAWYAFALSVQVQWIGWIASQIPDIALYCFIGGSLSEIIDIAETGLTDRTAFIVVLAVTLVLSIIGVSMF